MSVIAFLPLLVSVLGLLVYLIVTKAEIKEAGRLAYFAGLLVFLFSVANKVINFSF